MLGSAARRSRRGRAHLQRAGATLGGDEITAEFKNPGANNRR